MRLKKFLIRLNITIILLAFLLEFNISIFNNLFNLINGGDALISDYFIKGSIGSSFLNVGLLGLISTLLLSYFKEDFESIDFSAIMLMSGFGFIGKNIFNVWPIIFGVYLYTKVFKKSLANNLSTAYLASCLAPIFSQFTFVSKFNLLHFLVGLFLSILAGFIIPIIAPKTKKLHKGYNLYNIGFSAGIVSSIFVFIIRLFNFEIIKETLVYSQINNSSYLFIFTLAIFIIIYGYINDNKSFNNYKALLKTSGHNSNYYQTFNFNTVLINIGFNILLTIIFLFIFKIPINGLMLCGFFTIVGFSINGKHIKNITPIYLGVILACYLRDFSITDPSIYLTTLFLTGLAPFVGHYGFILGVIISYINIHLALKTGYLHAGLNLYNTGFSIGILLSITIPIIETSKNLIKQIKTNQIIN